MNQQRKFHNKITLFMECLCKTNCFFISVYISELNLRLNKLQFPKEIFNAMRVESVKKALECGKIYYFLNNDILIQERKGSWMAVRCHEG